MLLKREAGSCACCGKVVEVEVAGPLARTALVAGWLAAGVGACAVMALGPYMVLGIPVFMAAGLGGVLPLHQWAAHIPTCPACGKVWSTPRPAPAHAALSLAKAG